MKRSFLSSIGAYSACFATSCSTRHIFLDGKIISDATLWRTCLRNHYWLDRNGSTTSLSRGLCSAQSAVKISNAKQLDIGSFTCWRILYSKSEICAVSQVHLLATLDRFDSRRNLARYRTEREVPSWLSRAAVEPNSVSSSQLSPPGKKVGKKIFKTSKTHQKLWGTFG